ncbi:putative 5-formyltetrahydrofolate cyclo-ligase [Bacillus sp. THAF10]|uniref:5-formyltetrahydrofolate cyclo-ligase n=1 Tax=Bacillus sp. THAF10 TaxID=2587848 RepID=UPI0012A96EAF|nr:5-formyltetrahydrofolate cyclo-ligase [Bacillus sp. THAF10]QFT89839.1 putative 5-formyltetrahydrofolate cyclo-ligase [Bacillus sp. THAF10]
MSVKEQMRQQMKARLSTISQREYELKSKMIQERFFTSKEWKNAATIGVTISRIPEVDTKNIIEAAWGEGKRVAVPKCYPKNKEMTFFSIEGFHQLETVYFGLKEPIVEETAPMGKNMMDMLLVPGLIFDTAGYRIGFGGGYYDRFLIDFTGHKFALAFQEQIVNQVPKENYDIPVHKIMTNEGEYDTIIRK